MLLLSAVQVLVREALRRVIHRFVIDFAEKDQVRVMVNLGPGHPYPAFAARSTFRHRDDVRLIAYD